MQRFQRKKVIIRPTRLIFLLVGPARSGKTELMVEIAEMLRDRVEIIRSVTTRPRRSGRKDSLQYEFITEKEYHIKKDRNEFVEAPPRHQGGLYALERKTVDKVDMASAW